MWYLSPHNAQLCDSVSKVRVAAALLAAWLPPPASCLILYKTTSFQCVYSYVSFILIDLFALIAFVGPLPVMCASVSKVRLAGLPAGFHHRLLPAWSYIRQAHTLKHTSVASSSPLNGGPGHLYFIHHHDDQGSCTFCCLCHRCTGWETCHLAEIVLWFGLKQAWIMISSGSSTPSRRRSVLW